MRSDFPNLTPLDVVHALACADAPVLLDIRLPDDTAEYPGMIPGAMPVAYDDVEAQLALARPNGAIAICHKGLKLSAGAAARLLNRGCPAWRIAGGQMAWLAAGLPVVDALPPAAIALPLDASPKEAASAWATVRFAAPRAEVLEVPRNDLVGVAEKFDATLPVIEDALALPDLVTLLGDAATDGLFAAQLAGAGPRPSAAFACLDAAYRGRLQGLRHETDTVSGATFQREGTLQ